MEKKKKQAKSFVGYRSKDDINFNSRSEARRAVMTSPNHFQKEVKPEEDSKLLNDASMGINKAKQLILKIETKAVVFIGPYNESRTKKALTYLRKIIAIRENK